MLCFYGVSRLFNMTTITIKHSLQLKTCYMYKIYNFSGHNFLQLTLFR